VLTRRVLATLALVLALAATGTVPAGADPGDGAECPPTQTTCDGWDTHVPPPPGDGGGTGNGNQGGGNGGGSGPCLLNGAEVPCYDDLLGSFNSGDGCYYRVAAPQPPGGGAGQTAYVRSCGSGPFVQSDLVWLTAAPAGAPPPPDPADVARRALAQLDLMLPEIRTAPDAAGAGLVGLPVWVWLPANDGADDASWWADLSTVRTERGVRVELTAHPSNVVFDMGDGNDVTCTTRGTPYDGQGGASPDCGYAEGYAKSSRGRPGGKYTITATVTWLVEWESGDEEGTIPDVTRQSTTSIQIDELQVVTG
jgi:hypothetical protein